MSDVAATLLPALPVIAGGVVTGLFTLAIQRGTRKADHERWKREAAERSRARFHETRLTAYTEFAAQVSNACGYLSYQAIRKRRGETAPLNEDHPEFNQDAARKMIRKQTLVAMLAASDDTRAAAIELVDAVLGVLMVDSNDPEWQARITANMNRVGELHQRFVDAARAELAS